MPNVTGVGDGPIRFAVVGTNPYAEMHLAALGSLPRSRLVAVCGRNQERAQEVAARHHVDAVHADYEAMLAGGGIDAVLIVAPDGLHAPIASFAARHGVHVVCEKPLAATVAQAQEMCAAVDAAGVANMAFFVLQHTNLHRRMKAMVDAGDIGEVTSAEFSLTHGFFRGQAYDWRFDASVGTGVIGDLGCYLADAALRFVGAVEQVSVVASSSRTRPRPDGRTYTPADDSASGCLAFANGAHATFAVSTVAHQASGLQSHRIRLYGSEGTLDLDHTFNGGRLLGALATDTEFVDLASTGSLVAGGTDDPDSPHRAGLGAFVDAVLDGRRVESDFGHGLRVQRVVDAALDAASTGGWMRVASDGGGR